MSILVACKGALSSKQLLTQVQMLSRFLFILLARKSIVFIWARDDAKGYQNIHPFKYLQRLK